MITQPLYVELSRFRRFPAYKSFAVLNEESGRIAPLILPKFLKTLMDFGIRCFVEDGPNSEDYRSFGIPNLSRKDIASRVDVALQVRCYKRGLDFYKDFEHGLLKVLYTTPHFDIFDYEPKVKEILPSTKIIDLTEFRDLEGNRSFHVFEESGMIGARLLLPFLRSNSKIALLGYNNLGRGALKTLCRAGFDVHVFRRDCFEELHKTLGQWDAVINALNWPKEYRGKRYLLTREDLLRMKDSAVILDLDVDEEGMGPFETTKIVDVGDKDAESGYFVNGIRHISIWGYPALDYELCIHKYSTSLMNILMLNQAQGGLFLD